jgi:hypothetical protein
MDITGYRGISPERRSETTRALVQATDDAELFLYPGKQHLFADSSVPSYDEHAARCSPGACSPSSRASNRCRRISSRRGEGSSPSGCG